VPVPVPVPAEAIPPAPAITGAKTATATVGTEFRYRIEASHAPTGYFAWMIGSAGTSPAGSSLPKGLTYDTRTGLISGVPTAPGVFSISVAAMNRGGVGAGSVAVTVAEAAKQ
jgi:hypothetical protein